MCYKKYLTLFTAGVIALLSSTLLINITFDPLWYFAGNKVGQYNYAFNERVSKLNLLRNKDIDCLILGSSRTTFIKASKISNATCFNIAFSGGRVEEFVRFAEFLKEELPTVKHLVIGVDGSNFLSAAEDMPTKPIQSTFFLPSYLSIDTLLFSYRLLQEEQNLPRVYNHNFEVELAGEIPIFDPSKPLEGAISGHYKPEKFDQYLKLVEILKPENVLFYVPPLSAWHIADMMNKDILTSYMDFIYKFPLAGYSMIDYSIVSKTTLNVDNTYDGHHFIPVVNDLITADINHYLSKQLELSADFGIAVGNLSFKQYKNMYSKRLDDVASVISFPP